jgi:hypothetical protein
MERISRSWEMVKSSWRVLRADKELAAFPVLAGLVTLIAMLVLFGLYVLITGDALSEISDKVESEASNGWSIADAVFIFLAYFVTSVVATFFNAALVGAALMRIRGGDPTFGDGLAMARSRMGSILGYGAISATVGLLISMLRSRSNALGDVAAGVLSFGWGVMTFLVVPVLVAEKIGPVDAVKRSGSLLRKTWGEQIVGNAAIGLIGLLAAIPVAVVGGLLIAGAAGVDSDVLIGLSVLLLVLGLAAIGIVFSALNAIYKAAVYEYAAEQVVASQFGSGVLQTAFREK